MFTDAQLVAVEWLQKRTPRRFKVAHCLKLLTGEYYCLDLNLKALSPIALREAISATINSWPIDQVLTPAPLPYWHEFGQPDRKFEGRNMSFRRVFGGMAIIIVKQQLEPVPA